MDRAACIAVLLVLAGEASATCAVDGEAPRAVQHAWSNATGNLRIALLDRTAKKPAAGIRIRARSEGGTGTEREAMTDASGIAAFQLPAGEWRYWIDSPGSARCERSAAVVDDPDAATGQTLRLAPSSSVSGRVVDGEGRPIAGATVTLSREEPAKTDAEGRFAFDGLEGPLREFVSARATGHVSRAKSVEVKKGQQLRGVELQLPEAFSLIVRATSDGAPCAGAHAMVVPMNGAAQQALLDGSGMHRFEGLPKGPINVYVDRFRELIPAPMLHPIFVVRGASDVPDADEAWVTLGPGPVREVTLSLPKVEGTCVLKGAAVDRKGRAIKGAEVSVHCADITRKVSLDSTGAFVADRLPEGPCFVSLTTPKGGTGESVQCPGTVKVVFPP